MSAYIMTDDEINIIVSYFIEPMQARDAGAYVKVGDNYDYLNIMNSAQVAKIPTDTTTTLKACTSLNIYQAHANDLLAIL